jgi:polyphosphate kinase 2 (PPK2 family)
MGFCTADQTQDFLNAAPEFERHLVDDGMLLFKYWLCCDQAVQEERFENRLRNPTRRWKLSPIDIQAREHYDDYTEARELMLAATHTDFAPWTLVDFNDQPIGRLTLLRDLLDRVPDTELPLADIPWPPLAKPASKEHYGVLQPISNYPVGKHHHHDAEHRHGDGHKHGG